MLKNDFKQIYDVVKVLNDQIYLEKEIEKAKIEYCNVRDFAAIETFKFFDKANKGFLSLSDFKEAIKLLFEDVRPFYS